MGEEFQLFRSSNCISSRRKMGILSGTVSWIAMDRKVHWKRAKV